MYLLLDENFRVKEMIPDINPIFPHVPITMRYEKDLVDSLIYVADDTDVSYGYAFNEETQTWAWQDPPVYEVVESVSAEPTELEQLRADVDYIAMETGVSL